MSIAIPSRERSRDIRKTACIALALLAGCGTYAPEPLDLREAWSGLERVRLADLAAGSAVRADDGVSADEAAVLAVLGNPELRVLRAERGLAEAMLVESGQIDNPELEVMGLRGTDGWMTSAWLAFDLTAALLERGLKLDRARLDARRSGWEVAAREWDVASEARVLHVDAQYAAEAAALNEDQRRIAERAVELVRSRAAVGSADVLELTAAEIELAELRRRAVRLEGERRTALQRLNAALGLPPGHDTRLEGPPGLRFAKPPWEPAALRARLASSRLDLRAALAAYDASEKSLHLAFRRRWPSVRFGPAADREGGMTSVGAGIMLEIPILNWNGGEIAVRSAERAKAREAFVARLFAARAAFDRATTEWETLGAELAVVFDDVAPRLDASLELAEKALAANQGDVLRVLQLQVRVLELKREILAMLRDWHHAAVAVEREAGPEEVSR